ncbi:MAG: ABC transporter permease [Planctomycetota bacterium]|nr:ABC transporter permease [Planctomycetota bacterium]
MGFWNTLRIAIRALGKNKMRAGLTVLGVVIGIAAVTAMVSIGQSLSQVIQGQFDSLGTNVIIVSPKSERRGGVRQNVAQTLTADDAQAMVTHCENVKASSPLVGTSGQVIYGNANWRPSEMLGVGEGFEQIGTWQVLEPGRFFNESDISSRSKVCVIGQTVRKKIFQTRNPLGKSIRIRNVPFRVVGVLKGKGTDLVGRDQDNIVLMPYSTVRKRLQGSSFNNVDLIFVSSLSQDKMGDATYEINQLLLDRHKIRQGESPDFEVQSSTQIAAIFGAITGTITMFLSAVAGISLLVGGVGIMNIMLVSVTERTREIGIRMAVGARSWDILFQFLVESVLLSCFGGLVGFAIGVGASAGGTVLINYLSPGADWPVVISLPAGIIAFVFASIVGVVFGLYPAIRASRLDPIDALRYE